MPRTTKHVDGAPQAPALMPAPDLNSVADAVKRRAESDGHVVIEDVRAELEKAGQSPDSWAEVLKLASTHLMHRAGKYFYVVPTSPLRERQERQQHAIEETVDQLVGQYRQLADQAERREANRIQFMQAATVRMEGQPLHRVLTRDISASGIRLLGTKSMLGQRVQVEVPGPAGEPFIFLVRMVWACEVADNLYENGGVLLEVVNR